ncbi:hypothetical protein MLD38_025280 [Melastoma candidum]|uniref:Uncharacterized protein n=1 Tax=Melastoma candidum TaxID=119954 RepID=A0ACB9NVC2_9MYRT|nr:hypothetical protein MLD38_025280 [Melastoma candidum]
MLQSNNGCNFPPCLIPTNRSCRKLTVLVSVSHCGTGVITRSVGGHNRNNSLLPQTSCRNVLRIALFVCAVAIEIICVALQTIVYSFLLYSIIGFQWTDLAEAPLPSMTSSYTSFSSFLLPRPYIPLWWRWYYWCTPVVWPIYDIFASLYGNKMNDMDIEPEPSMALNAFLNKYAVFAHIGFALIFYFVFATASSRSIQSSDSM